jgi:hypothetical protein
LKKLTLSSAVLVTALSFGSTAYSATAQVNAFGDLTGINGVDLGVYGTYDVSFGTTINSYDDAFAQAASGELFRLLDSNELSAGDVNPSSFIPFQSLYTFATPEVEFDPSLGPVLVHTAYVAVNDQTATDADFDFTTQFLLGFMSNPYEFEVDGVFGYATEWSKSATVSAVPVPAAAFLFAPALLGFMALRRKQKSDN